LLREASKPYTAPPLRYAEICPAKDILAVSPQLVNLDSMEDSTPVFFRVREERESVRVRFVLESVQKAADGVRSTAGPIELFSRNYQRLRPPEMERITLSLKNVSLVAGSRITITVEE
jgi:hypothetical protein